MKTNNPFKDRDLSETLRWPALSWSSYNSFVNYDKEDWYKQYVLGEKLPPNPAMLAGQIIGERLATDRTYLPEVPRPTWYEVELKAKLGNINLVGHLDGLSKGRLLEYKTSSSSVRWTKASVAKHGQITFYCLLLWLTKRISPESLKIDLVYIPVSMDLDFEVKRNNEPIQIIPTKRSMSDILRFGAELSKVYKEMQDYIKNHPVDNSI